jgi:hypothetical protein
LEPCALPAATTTVNPYCAIKLFTAPSSARDAEPAGTPGV